MTTTNGRPCNITLYDDHGEPAGRVCVLLAAKGRMRVIGREFWAGRWVARRPLALIRRILVDWVYDGADRDYSGRDDRTGVQFRVAQTAPLTDVV